MRTALWLILCVCVAMMGTGGVTAAADFPNKPIQVIIPYAAGGSTDLLARTVAKIAPKFIPQPLVVVNKPGGSGMPGRLDVMKAKADGYTILFGYGSGEDTVLPHQRQLPVDPYKDFEPVCRISVHSLVLVAPVEAPFKTVDELVKWSKAKGQVTGAVGTKGGSADIAITAFAKVAGINMTPVPGRGGADAVNQLVGGHVDYGVLHPSELLPHVKAGRLRALGVIFEKRDPTVDVPTVKELGYDIATAGSVKGMAFVKGTPKELIAYLDQKCKTITEDAEFQKIMADIGQPVMYQGAEEYKVWIRKVYEQYGQLIKTLGIKAE